ncbi:phosphatidylserine decarboxylase [Kocuria marina]|uniref:phosphatidylserine decarboxylase n=1 Tax=Kocuria marina TaxID=223184 RepID=UPI00384F275C
MDQFVHGPSEEHWGFTSWNDFFTRHSKDGDRPVAAPDEDRIITSVCESTPCKISTGVQRRDEFWVKEQPYSIEDLLAHDPDVDEFVDGAVFQTFLSVTNYHRWHSPVAGTVRRAVVQPGTYFFEADTEGKDAIEPPESQGYLAHMATRAIIQIEADNPAIGLVAVVLVGMNEVSSCVIDPHVTPGPTPLRSRSVRISPPRSAESRNARDRGAPSRGTHGRSGPPDPSPPPPWMS